MRTVEVAGVRARAGLTFCAVVLVQRRHSSGAARCAMSGRVAGGRVSVAGCFGEDAGDPEGR